MVAVKVRMQVRARARARVRVRVVRRGEPHRAEGQILLAERRRRRVRVVARVCTAQERHVEDGPREREN
jgi:hypothetical protein